MDQPARLGELELTDGRVLGWAEWGAPDGTPVLLSPGAATSRSLGFGFAELDGLGVRLVSVDRPGLGASGPDPGRGFASFARDVGELAAHRGLGRPPMVGNSQGAPFALAAASAGVVSGLAVVSGAAAYRKAMGEAFAQGAAGYARDTVLAMGRWSIDLAAIRVPVWLWYGAEDTSHSPDNGAWLATRIPGARRELVDGIGGAVLWTHAGPILRALLRGDS